METLEISAQQTSYKVEFGDHLMAKAGELLKDYSEKKMAIITDEHVAPIYLKTLEKALDSKNIAHCAFVLPPGESTKSNADLLKIYDFLLENAITRTDCLIALGGGVIGDLVGYAAATYLRGTPVIQIPTTLLAQVDSSVGGKVAINLPQGKNLIGTFMQPAMVLCDISALATLDLRQKSCGIAEIIKYGCIASEPLFNMLEQNLLDANLEQVIYDCCAIKANVVAQDPYDKGLRMCLNFGHTLAHAIEKNAGYGFYTHGEAVALGMIAAAKWGEALDITPKDQKVSQRITQVCRLYNLPTQLENLDTEQLILSMMGDKKSEGAELNIVLLDHIGSHRIRKIKKSDFESLVRSCI